MIRNRKGLAFGLAALVLFAGCQKDSPNPVTPGGVRPESASEPVSRLIGDRVWHDANHDGVQNSGELGILSMFVDLYTCDGTFVARDTTDAAGLYAFLNQPVGDYKLLFMKPSNWAFSPADQGTSNNTDSDADTTTGWTVCTHLAQNQLDFSWDAGLYPLPPPRPTDASLGDLVWIDLNANGIQDAGEFGVSDVTVQMLGPDGTVIATQTTNGSGGYKFANLAPGDYRIRFIPPFGYAFSPADHGGNDLLDSDALANGHTTLIHLPASTADLSWDAGIYLRTGGCCSDNGNCQVLTPDGCTEIHGLYRGDAASCDPNLCVQPTGFCCALDGTCSVTLEADCTGTWTMFGACDPNPCNQPTGSCCALDGKCAATLEADCTGTWTMFGACDPNPCVQPTGACCTPNGACTLTTQAACTGTWREIGTNCDPNPCVQPTGACCATNGTCKVTNQAACTGTWRGMRTNCSPNPCVQPTGACCATNGTCEVTTQAACTGTWRGMETNCDPNPCVQPTGACCATNGTCRVTTQTACAGTWQGVGTTCCPNPCVHVTGACCATNGACKVTTQAACTGTWQGAGTTCCPNPCPQHPLQGNFCTLTQEAYGNANGMFNGERRLAMIQRLITVQSPLMLGKPGRSVTIPDGSEQCVINRLPAGCAASQLPNIGNGTVASGTCNTGIPLPLKNGRFQDAFLGQVIALSLNTRLDPNLSSVGLCGTMVTSAGRFTISQKVRTALTNQGLGQTAGGLLELANRALAYGTVGGASVSEINCAVDAINAGFDECRTLLSCY